MKADPMTEREARGGAWDPSKAPVDLADLLAQELYGRNAMARDLLGGSNAKILKHAVDKITELRKEIAMLDAELAKR